MRVIPGAALILVLAATTTTTACRRRPPPSDPPPAGTVVVWFPFADGMHVECGQGPFSNGSHLGLHAWDFVVAEGTPIVAAAAGRVVHVVDDRTTTGRNEFNEANRIVIDLGDGLYASYVHQRAFSARVKPGDEVHRGMQLGQVGNVGTIVPHLHFDVRRADETRNVWFRTSDAVAAPAEQGRRYTSRTRAAAAPLEDRVPPPSRITGRELIANGIELEAGALSFEFPVEEPIVIRGRARRPGARSVGFYLWRDGSPSDHVAVVPCAPDDGRFVIETRIPSKVTGPHWWRLAIADGGEGQRPNTATLPARVGAKDPR